MKRPPKTELERKWELQRLEEWRQQKERQRLADAQAEESARRKAKEEKLAVEAKAREAAAREKAEKEESWNQKHRPKARRGVFASCLSFWKRLSRTSMTQLERAALDGDRDQVNRLLKECGDPSIIKRAIELANKAKWHAVAKDLEAALGNVKVSREMNEIIAIAQTIGNAGAEHPTTRPSKSHEGVLTVIGTGTGDKEKDKRAIIDAINVVSSQFNLQLKAKNVELEFWASPDAPNDFMLRVNIGTVAPSETLRIQKALVAGLAARGLRV